MKSFKIFRVVEIKKRVEGENSEGQGGYIGVFGLADAIGAVLGLEVVCDVPGRIEDDDNVRRGDVQTETA